MSKKTKQIDDLIRTILMSNPRIRFNVSDLYYEYKKRGGMLLSNERVQIKRAIERINDSRIKQEKEKNKLLFYYDSVIGSAKVDYFVIAIRNNTFVNIGDSK